MSRSAVRTPRRLLTNQFSMLLGIIAVAGTGLILVREINYGVGLSDDSVEYISVAKSLLEGEGFTRYYGGTLIRFPPSYPMILAGLSFFSLDPLDIAGPLNAVLFGLTIFVVGRWLKQRLMSPLLALWGCLILMFSIPVAEITSRAMSEPAYILLSILALIQVDNYIHKGTRSALIWAAILTALACTIRFAGFPIVAIVTLMLILKRNTTSRDKIRHIAMYSSISLVPVLIWMLRTYITYGKFAGNRTFEPYSLSLALEFLYSEVILQGDPIWLLLPIVPLVILLASPYISSRASSSSSSSSEPLGFSWHTVFLYFGFVLMHMLMLFGAFFYEILGYDSLRFHIPRFMLPTYVPLLIGVLLLLDRVLNHWQIRWLNVSCITVLLLSLVYQMSRNVGSIQASNDLGFGYNNRRWAESEALQYVRDAELTGTIFSNYVGPVYVHTDTLTEHRFLPCERSELRSTLFDEDSAANVYILWLYDSHQTCDRQGSYGLDDLFDVRELEAVALPADGVLFKLNEGVTSAEPYRLHQLKYESAVAGELLIRSVFDVHITDNSINYAKESCSPDDTELPFFLHLIPVKAEDLPSARQSSSFDNLDFHFDDLNVSGLRFDGKCLATIPLPDYDIALVRTGQWIPAENRNLWEAEVALK